MSTVLLCTLLLRSLFEVVEKQLIKLCFKLRLTQVNFVYCKKNQDSFNSVLNIQYIIFDFE